MLPRKNRTSRYIIGDEKLSRCHGQRRDKIKSHRYIRDNIRDIFLAVSAVLILLYVERPMQNAIRITTDS